MKVIELVLSDIFWTCITDCIHKKSIQYAKGVRV